VTVYPSGRLAGRGTIKGNLFANNPFPNVTGQYKPLVAIGTSPGLLTVEGDVVLGPDTILEMEIGGLAAGIEHDQLVATGSVEANGILNLIVANGGSGFELPNVGDQFTLISASNGISGAFENAASLRSIAGGSLVDWSLSSGANDAILEVTAITTLVDGDYNGDGLVGAADYTVWRDTLGGINLAADGNRDGAVDGLDYDVWKAHFGDVAPGAGSGSAGASPSQVGVPEPASLPLFLIGGVLLCGRLRSARRLAQKSQRSPQFGTRS
jgi:hypothetical protein